MMGGQMEGDVEKIHNFVRIGDRLGTSGQPRAEQFAAIQEAGYEVVINLALPSSTGAVADEAQRVTALSMDYVNIPVVWERPTAANLDEFLEVMDENEGRQMFVHCQANMRVSAFVLLYRVIRQGVPLEIAREAMLKIWEPNPTWQQFIADTLERYRPAG